MYTLEDALAGKTCDLDCAIANYFNPDDDDGMLETLLTLTGEPVEIAVMDEAIEE